MDILELKNDINEYKENGFLYIINTCRERKIFKNVISWCHLNEIIMLLDNGTLYIRKNLYYEYRDAFDIDLYQMKLFLFGMIKKYYGINQLNKLLFI